LSKARRLRLLVGTFLLALSVILTGCSGSVTQEQKEEKKKMLKKKEEKKDKEKKKEK
jgi:outer membrane biogenesis lipoprotein LolB